VDKGEEGFRGEGVIRQCSRRVGAGGAPTKAALMTECRAAAIAPRQQSLHLCRLFIPLTWVGHFYEISVIVFWNFVGSRAENF